MKAVNPSTLALSASTLRPWSMPLRRSMPPSIARQACCGFALTPTICLFPIRLDKDFENKVAEILAKAMGRKLQYYWGSYATAAECRNFSPSAWMLANAIP